MVEKLNTGTQDENYSRQVMQPSAMQARWQLTLSSRASHSPRTGHAHGYHQRNYRGAEVSLLSR